ncbi:uncharacterized protein LOC131690716 [Topomyia yanbarensis]|uniref:uncharacterized protein LOC131690716 n=1 Tax=Topomyia yanbarensis TaxID=2498891 RepID=UPI00273B6E15|nr:uncharacterized protein LOC131690716 [Topomyia yanbarensis]
MNRWLALACILGSLSGAYSFYSPITVGSNGLITIANSLKSISTVVANYYTALNTARTKIFVGLNDLLGYANITYGALNKTYGDSQPNMLSMVQSVGYLNTTVSYGDQSVTSYISQDLNQLSNSLKQGIDNIMQTYSNLQSASSYAPYAENCTIRNATQMANFATSLTKLGTCLQVESDQATALVPVVLGTIAVLKSDLIALNNQLKICNPASTKCINQYFSDIWMEWNTFQQNLYLVQTIIYSPQQFAYQRNSVCGQLTIADIQDDLYDLQNTFGACSYPQS